MKASGIFKLSTLTLLTSFALGAQAGTSVSNEQGTFTISGDVEFDTNYRNQEDSTAAIKDKTTYDQTGRLLIGISGKREVGSNGYISANAQTLLNMSGDVSADDAWVAFGETSDWEIKLGRFEAYNLFPAGQDTYLNHAQDVYTTSYARGRSSNGQINFSKTMDSIYLEVSTNFMENAGADENAVFLRPVVAFSFTDSLKLSAGAEVNVTADEADTANDFTGYGATLNYAADDLDINVSYAYRDFDTKTQEDTTIGANILYKNFGLGYVFGTTDTGTESEVNTVYASYKFANVMEVEDLALYLGAYGSEVKDSDDTDTGARLRVKYLF